MIMYIYIGVAVIDNVKVYVRVSCEVCLKYQPHNRRSNITGLYKNQFLEVDMLEVAPPPTTVACFTSNRFNCKTIVLN